MSCNFWSHEPDKNVSHIFLFREIIAKITYDKWCKASQIKLDSCLHQMIRTWLTHVANANEKQGFAQSLVAFFLTTHEWSVGPFAMWIMHKPHSWPYDSSQLSDYDDKVESHSKKKMHRHLMLPTAELNMSMDRLAIYLWEHTVSRSKKKSISEKKHTHTCTRCEVLQIKWSALAKVNWMWMWQIMVQPNAHNNKTYQISSITTTHLPSNTLIDNIIQNRWKTKTVFFLLFVPFLRSECAVFYIVGF